jgi:hypothetical protein
MEEAEPPVEVRIVSTMTAAGYLWRAWCEVPGCSWTGPTRRGGFGSREAAEADGTAHFRADQAARTDASSPSRTYVR